MLLLEQDITKKRRVNKNNVTKWNVGSNEGNKYKLKAICDSAVYARELKSGHLPGLYYLVFWKDYLKEENNREPYSAIQYLRKLISLFYKVHLDKPIAISKVIDTALPIARPTIKPAAKPTTLKQKRVWSPGNNTNK